MENCIHKKKLSLELVSSENLFGEHENLRGVQNLPHSVNDEISSFIKLTQINTIYLDR